MFLLKNGQFIKYERDEMIVVAKLSKEHYNCYMCSFTGYAERYIVKPHIVDIDKEYIICSNCAKREHGNKNRIKLQDVIDERTKRWLKLKQKKNQ